MPGKLLEEGLLDIEGVPTIGEEYPLGVEER